MTCVLAVLLGLACNQRPAEPASQSSPAPRLVPELSTGTKSSFGKIETLPEGIENIFGKMPSKENGFYKFSFPRTDLHIMLDGVQVDPRLAFTSWIALMPFDSTGNSMLMGDLILKESELKNVLKKLDEKGIDISAIHNHLLGESPKIMYMHVMSMGKPLDILQGMKEVLAQTATPLQSKFDSVGIADWGNTEDTFGYTGNKDGNLLRFNIPRNEKIKDGGIELPETFGIGSAITFQKVGGKAAVTGDFVLIPSEVNTVQRILSRANILVTALHSHMLFEQPRLFFMHFWAVDDPAKLGAALHEVMRSTNHVPPRK